MFIRFEEYKTDRVYPQYVGPVYINSSKVISVSSDKRHQGFSSITVEVGHERLWYVVEGTPDQVLQQINKNL